MQTRQTEAKRKKPEIVQSTGRTTPKLSKSSVHIYNRLNVGARKKK